MARTTQKSRNRKSGRVTRDLPASGKNSKSPKGGLDTSTGIQVALGDGSVRSSGGLFLFGDGSVRTVKPGV